MCVLFIDIDRFAALNAMFGPAAGDRILAALQGRIDRGLQPDESVFRLQGDEFVVVSPRVAAESDAEALASRLLSTISEPLNVEGLPEVQCTASIGITLFPADGQTAEELVERAKLVMGALKEQGRNAYARFRSGVIEPSFIFLNLDHRIYHGLERGEFHLHFAPIVDIRAGGLLALNALTRWAHPQLGLLSASQYLVSPTSAAALRIEESMLLAACSQAMSWTGLGAHVPRVSMNVSARAAMAVSFLVTLQDVFERTGFPAERLGLEMDERELTDLGDDGPGALRRLADRGIQIAVDHFSGGRLSLKSLRRFPITVLKLDKAIVCDASSPKSQSVLAGAVIASAHGAGLRVVFDGVETRAQLEFLRAEGCDAVQGALAGRPLPPAETRAFLQTFDTDRLALTAPK